MSNTPQYDALIEPILAELVPGKRICRVTGEEFEITQQEIDLLQKMRLPPPTTTPRFRRTLLAAPLNYFVLHTRKSDATGKEIISEFSPKSPYKIWEQNIWWSDNWNPLDFAKEYDSNRSFFDQFHGLDLSVPRSALFQDNKSERSDYVLGGMELRDCYMVFGGAQSERMLFSESPFWSKDCTDSSVAEKCENCYEITECTRCYDCQYSIECVDCLESRFLFDCHNCTNCFLCTNLRNKKYCFKNEQLSEEEYKTRLAEINLGDRNQCDSFWEEFELLLQNAYYRALRMTAAEDSLGDELVGVKRCHECFYVRKAENLVHAVGGIEARDSADIITNFVELAYGCTRLMGGYHAFFTTRSRDCRYTEYCTECYQCENCFGCVGLRNKKFCILNRQFEEEEYWKLVDQIKVDMMERGEYGEIFPLLCSPVPYQDSWGATWPQFHTLPFEDVIRYGGWTTDEVPDSQTSGAISYENIPTDIRDVPDEILNQTFVSKSGKKAIRFVPNELAFYRKHGIPLPVFHFSERRETRFRRLRPLVLFDGTCDGCKKIVKTTFPQDRPGKVLCEDCYLKTVY